MSALAMPEKAAKNGKDTAQWGMEYRGYKKMREASQKANNKIRVCRSGFVLGEGLIVPTVKGINIIKAGNIWKTLAEFGNNLPITL